MAKGRIGLDIGSTAVRAAELSAGTQPTVVRAAQGPLPPSAVENGEVRDPAAVSDALRELWRRGGFSSGQVWLGVGNQRVIVREIALPFLPEKELKASLSLQVQEFIPMPVDEAVLDYDPIGEFEQDDRKMLRMLLVAAQRAMVDQVVQAVSGAGLEPMGLDLIPFALVRAVGTPDVSMDLEEGGEEAIIDIGAHVTNIVVHDRGDTRFVRILPSGGRDVTTAIARAAGVDDAVAERLKRGDEVDAPVAEGPEPTDGSEGAAAPEAGAPPRLQQVRQVALQRAAAFVDEIRSSLEFYTAQAREARIARVLVTGGGSKLEGLIDLMRQRIPVPVDPGRVFLHVPSELAESEEAMAAAEPFFAVAVGLAIPGRA
ncbi:MAG: type IV pilus assembly protein PilM [Actinobacteria bacterium]|nr:MAG: type IV pilus assembly protein PilM [Actinomycetota bacterium]